MLSVGSIISGAFELPRRQPLAFGIWSLLYALIGVLGWFVVQPAILAQQGAAPPADAFQYMGWMLLMQFANLVLIVILYTATQRAMLRPEQDGLGFLRIGMDELRALALAILLVIAFYFGLFIAAIAIAVPVAAGMSVASGPAVVILIVIAALALLAFVVWLQVRLSLVFTLTFIRGKIIIGESWELTRGRFWTLFGGYLVVFLILLALWIVVSLFTAAPYLSEIMQRGFNPETMQVIAADQLRSLGPMTVAGWLLGGIVGALGISLIGGAAASVVRDLGVHREDIASTFA